MTLNGEEVVIGLIGEVLPQGVGQPEEVLRVRTGRTASSGDLEEVECFGLLRMGSESMRSS